MNKTQLKKAIEITQNDATIHNYYYADGETCFIGGLALATRFPKEKLIEACSRDICSGVPIVMKLAKHIIKHFGLSVTDQTELQEINDNTDSLRSRRRKLITKLNTIYRQQKGK